jgi:hypothetical protein
MLLRFAHFRNACKPRFPDDSKGVRDRRARRNARLYRGCFSLDFFVACASTRSHERRDRGGANVAGGDHSCSTSSRFTT